MAVVGGIIDLWSIVHLAFFMVLGSTVEALSPTHWWVHAIYGIGLSYGWETCEFFLQRKFPDKWSNRIEHALNSWLTDPLFNLAGLAFGVFVVRYYR